MTLKEFINKAMFVPFKDNGRDYDGWDCWGLLRRGYRDVYNISIHSYDRAYRSIRDTERIKELVVEGKAKNWWEPVIFPREGDTVVLYLEGRPIHVGLMLGDKKFMHTDEGVNTCIQKLSDFRVEGIYRYNEDNKLWL